MRRVIFGLLILGWGVGVEAACPSRDNTYIKGTIIQPQDVLENENALFEGIQAGLETDCIADNAITTAKLATGSVTSADILDGTITTTDLAFAINPGNTLPAGAVFFMLTGSCPSWTTDISATYSNYFIRVNATQGTTGGDTTHTHTAGTYAGSAHTHSFTSGNANESPTGGGGTGASNMGPSHTHSGSTGSGGGGAISGTSASGSHVPTFVQMRLCQVS